MRTCKGRKLDGQRCQARPCSGSDFCFFHDPESADARRQAQCSGGRKRKRLHILANPQREFHLDNPHRITQLLEYAANGLVRGELDPKSAYVLGYIGDCALRAHKTGSLSERQDELQRLIQAEGKIPVGSENYLNTDFDEQAEVDAQDGGEELKIS